MLLSSSLESAKCVFSFRSSSATAWSVKCIKQYVMQMDSSVIICDVPGPMPGVQVSFGSNDGNHDLTGA